jgi:hypothetical protein
MTSTWRNAASAVKQRRGNHPGDFAFSAVAAFDTYYAADLVFHDFFLFAARDEQGDEFAEKRKMADDHDRAEHPSGLPSVGLRRFAAGTGENLVKLFKVYSSIPTRGNA